MSSFFAAHPDGVEILIDPDQLRALELISDLLDSVGTRAGDPGDMRLNPTTYLNDPQAQETYSRMMGAELEKARSRDREVLQALLSQSDRGKSPPVITDSQADSLLRVLNESRLVLAARLEVEEAGWENKVNPENATPPFLFLHFLTFMENSLVETLAAKL